jgi:hypothetical protein
MAGYIGVQPVPQATQTRQTFTATASQTSFATAGYAPGFVDVYLNGVRLINGTDYTATNGSDIVLTSGATAGDTLEILAFGTFEVNGQAFTGDFSVDSPTFVVDSTNNRVGVGTASPQATLQVLDQLKVSSTDQSSGSVVLGDGSSTSFNVGIARWNGGTNSAGAGGVGYFAQGPSNVGGHFFYTGDAAAGSTTERMRIDSSGNVGIGTSSIYSTAVNRSALSVNGVTDAIISLGNGTTENGFLYANASNTITGTRTATPYIFYTNNTERMRIDASGNLLVNLTSESTWTNTAGFATRSSGSTTITRSAAQPLLLNRLSTDGDIATFYKDGTTVGTIGTGSGRIHIGQGDTGLSASDTFNSIIPWNTSTNAQRDAGISLGGASARFTDLYLSGGVYLGGTGSANLLDDYEEGTFTPSITGGTTTNPTVSYSYRAGYYRKVGGIVTISFRISTSSISAGFWFWQGQLNLPCYLCFWQSVSCSNSLPELRNVRPRHL